MSCKSSLTPDVQKNIVRALRLGNYIEPACRAAGIHPSIYYRAMNYGRKGHEDWVAFYKEVEKAIATSELLDLERIRTASTVDWQAAKWRLERRFPQRWANRERHEHTGADGGPIKFDVRALSDEQLERLRKGEPPTLVLASGGSGAGASPKGTSKATAA